MCCSPVLGDEGGVCWCSIGKTRVCWDCICSPTSRSLPGGLVGSLMIGLSSKRSKVHWNTLASGARPKGKPHKPALAWPQAEQGCLYWQLLVCVYVCMCVWTSHSPYSGRVRALGMLALWRWSALHCLRDMASRGQPSILWPRKQRQCSVTNLTATRRQQ